MNGTGFGTINGVSGAIKCGVWCHIMECLVSQNLVSGAIKWGVWCYKMVSGAINCLLVLDDKVTLFVVYTNDQNHTNNCS